MPKTHASLSGVATVPYFAERRITEEMPDMTPDKLMTIKEAGDYLGRSASSITNFLDRGVLTTILDTEDRTAHLKPRRLVIRAEVEALKVKLQSP